VILVASFLVGGSIQSPFGSYKDVYLRTHSREFFSPPHLGKLVPPPSFSQCDTKVRFASFPFFHENYTVFYVRVGEPAPPPPRVESIPLPLQRILRGNVTVFSEALAKRTARITPAVPPKTALSKLSNLPQAVFPAKAFDRPVRSRGPTCSLPFPPQPSSDSPPQARSRQLTAPLSLVRPP